MGTIALYSFAVVVLGVSFVADRNRTRMAVSKAVKALSNIMPDFAAVVGLIGLILTFISPAVISRLLGSESGIGGWFLASLIGSITLIPGFVAFPLVASLIARGAGIGPMAVFVSTLMMVGVVTLPLEQRYLGKRVALIRNGLAYIWSFIVALIIVAVVSW